MRYLIEFRQGTSHPYFVFPSNGSHGDLVAHAKTIMREFFKGDSDVPQPLHPGGVVPNEIRIVGEDGQILARRLLMDEVSERQAGA